MKAPAHSHGAARKQRLDDRIGVRQVQSEVPESRGYSVVCIKKPEQPVRDPAQCEYILGTGALIAPQQEAISRVGGSAEPPPREIASCCGAMSAPVPRIYSHCAGSRTGCSGFLMQTTE